MAGRNLFAQDTAQPRGRNLFADTAAPAQQPQPQAQQPDQGFIDRLNQEILNAPGGTALAELGAAISSSGVGIADFLFTKPIRAGQKLLGVPEDKLPSTIRDTEFGKAATTGNYMDPGLARDMVQTGGELVGPALVGGAAFRTAAQAIPKVQAGVQTLGQRLTQQMGGSTAVQDVTGAALSGAGFEAGGEAGRQADIALGGTGETGEQIGKLAGSFGVPIGATIASTTAKNAVKSLATPTAKKLVKEAAPTIEGLKEAARGVYKEIDDLGAVIDPSRVSRLANELKSLAKREGFNRRIHPKVNAVLNEFDNVAGTAQPVSNIDTLRKVAQSAASSIEPSEKRLGTMIINRIDDSLDSLTQKDFIRGGGEVGAKFKDARQLWRRASKAQELEEAWKNAELSPAGFENGIRQQFRSILKSKKKRSGFTDEELKAMRGVVNGNTIRNLSEKLGMLGIDESRVSGALMPLMGSASGAFAFSGPGAIAVPVIGTVSKKLGLRLARNAARGAEAIVKAGNNGLDVAKAYLKITPRGQADPKELAELLLRPEISLKNMEKAAAFATKPEQKVISDAVFLANAMKQQEDEE